MKFNWGTGIALFYGAFVLAMVGIVIASRSHDPGLMQKDYYNLDLNYQERLEKKQNTAGLKDLPQVHFLAPSQTVLVQLPKEMNIASGNAKFYRPSTTGDDFTVKIDQSGTFDIPTAKLASGIWYVELDWEADGKKYYWETSVFITNA